MLPRICSNTLYGSISNHFILSPLQKPGSPFRSNITVMCLKAHYDIDLLHFSFRKPNSLTTDAAFYCFAVAQFDWCCSLHKCQYIAMSV